MCGAARLCGAAGTRTAPTNSTKEVVNLTECGSKPYLTQTAG